MLAPRWLGAGGTKRAPSLESEADGVGSQVLCDRSLAFPGASASRSGKWGPRCLPVWALGAQDEGARGGVQCSPRPIRAHILLPGPCDLLTGAGVALLVLTTGFRGLEPGSGAVGGAGVGVEAPGRKEDQGGTSRVQATVCACASVCEDACECVCEGEGVCV